MPKKTEQQPEVNQTRVLVIGALVFLASLWGTFYLSDVLACHYTNYVSVEIVSTCKTTWAFLPLWITGILICAFSFIAAFITAGLSD